MLRLLSILSSLARRRIHRSSAWTFVLGLVWMVSACSWGSLITLGQSEPPPPTGGQGGSGGQGASAGGASSGGVDGGGSGGLVEMGAQAGMGGEGGVLLQARSVSVIEELRSDESDDNPTLAGDELLLCFTSKRASTTGGTDIWCAERSSREEPFGEPSEVAELNTDGFESSSALSLDGLTLWFGSEVDGQVDVFVSMRVDRSATWGEKQLEEALSSDADDIPRPPGSGGRVMPLASRRDGEDYWTYLAERAGPGSEFTTPILIAELAEPGVSVVDAFLRDDGLLLLFKLQQGSDSGDLYTSVRSSLDRPFGAPVEIRGVNTDADERDPWLSTDGSRLYFSSDSAGEYDIYVAELEPAF